MPYDYTQKAPKLTDEFKKKFIVQIGKQKTEAITVDGLLALAHEKGIKKDTTKIIQFPSDANNWTAICETTIIGYDFDPILEQIVEVEYSDIGDANASNCSTMVASSYIRMASTRSHGRALRKYTNVDMVCSQEVFEVFDNVEPKMDQKQLESVKMLVKERHLKSEQFAAMVMARLKLSELNYGNLTYAQGVEIIKMLQEIQPPAAATEEAF